MPGTGIDAVTGQIRTGWQHVLQSVNTIFATRIAERVMLRQFGSPNLTLLGRRLIPRIIILYRLLLVLALERWEPRVRVRSIAISGTLDEVRNGQIASRVTVDYMPRGHLGDFTVATQRDIALQ